MLSPKVDIKPSPKINRLALSRDEDQRIGKSPHSGMTVSLRNEIARLLVCILVLHEDMVQCLRITDV